MACATPDDAGPVLLGANPPLTDEQLDSAFAKIAAVLREGRRSLLNP